MTSGTVEFWGTGGSGDICGAGAVEGFENCVVAGALSVVQTVFCNISGAKFLIFPVMVDRLVGAARVGSVPIVARFPRKLSILFLILVHVLVLL
ncbi:MAG: hypothetical protein JWL81_1135 [Verrucomicrobiales bacterium]|nr:hypothetical protein [Verrucomicrobiales bacterium]